MAEGKRTYYQVSFTGGQALAAVIAVILALGLAFFFGAKAGFERVSDAEAVPVAREARTAPAPVLVENSATTGVSPAATSSSATSASAPPAGSIEEAPVFEDREAGSPAIRPAPSTGPSRTEIAGAPATPPPKAAAPTSSPMGAPKAVNVPAKPSAGPSETFPTKAATPAKSGYYVQVLSTSSRSEAARWKDRLAAKSYRTVAVTTVDSKKGKLFRVRTGPYPDRAQAKKAAERISAEFKQKAWVASQ